MSTIQAVTEKVTEVTKLAAGLQAQAAANLVGKAKTLSLEVISSRLDVALRALRAVTTAPLTALQIAEEMVKSYAFDRETGVSTFTVPDGVTDVAAMKALNAYFRNNHSTFNRDAVFADHLEWFENLPREFPRYCKQRDYSQSRQITITVAVDGTWGLSQRWQGEALKSKSLRFSDPRDQALAAAIHACKHEGADLFQNVNVRGSVHGLTLITYEKRGVCVNQCNLDYRLRVAASGSPSPESK